MMKPKHKRPLAFLLCAALLIGQLGATAYAEGTTNAAGGLCEHHTEHIGCGHVEARPGHPCEHEHTPECYTKELICGMDEDTEQAATGSDAAHRHTDDCYKLDCPHERGEHDDKCGYKKAVKGAPCGYVCDQCGKEPDKDSGTAGTTNGNDLPVPGEPEPGAVQPEGAGTITVTAFNELDEAVRFQTVPAGTTLDDLTLPATLGASGYKAADGMEPVAEAITIDGVTWEPESPWDKTAGQGSYLFTPVLPAGYALANDKVELPEIAVRIGEEAVTLDTQGDVLIVEFNDDGNNDKESGSNMETAINTALSSSGANKVNIKTIKLTGSVTEITGYNWWYLMNQYTSSSGWDNLTALDLSGLENLKSMGYAAYGLDPVIKLTALYLPDSLTEIGEFAFDGCTSLNLQSLPDGLKQIGMGAFNGCTSLNLQSLPPDLTVIGDYAFRYCTSLKLQSLPEGLKQIGGSAFQGCTSLDLKELPASVEQIGDYAFRYCTSLKLQSLPDSVTEIGDSAFYGCTSLKLQSLPHGLTVISQSAFSGCTSLALQSLPEGLKQIGSSAFYGCTSLNLQSLPPDLTVIDSTAFSGCTSLKLQSLPPNLIAIGARAFDGCTGLDRIIMEPTTAPYLDYDVFAGIDPPPTIYVPKDGNGYNEGEWGKLKTKPYSPIKSISLQSTLELQPNESCTLIATIEPDNAVPIVIWESSNTRVVTVDNTGKVTAIENGTATITATSLQNKNKSATCAVTIQPKSADATLQSLTLSKGVLSPSFAPDTTIYKATVSNDVSSVNITAQANNSKATVSGDTGEKPLIVGATTFIVTVTAADGKTKKEYTVTITREASADATLQSLLISNVALIPGFDPDTTIYNATVSNDVSSVNITAQANDSKATVSGDTGAKPLNVGVNTFTVTVTAEDGKTKKEYTITITREASADAKLQSLFISNVALIPGFDPNTTIYKATVSNDVSSVNITAQANDSNATVSGDTGTKPLIVGANTFIVTVTAADGKAEKEYTVTITREASADATLQSLFISNVALIPSFDPNTTIYKATVSNDVSSVNITAQANDSNATVSGDTGAKPLNVGVNTFTVTVTAGDGKTKKEYTVTITREASADAKLQSLFISNVALIPGFDPNTTIYKATVSNDVSSVNITAQANDSNATVSGDTGAKPLNVGVNTFTVTVTAEDGKTKKEYTVTITREASADATLQSLSLPGVTLSPVFKPEITIYKATVSNDVSSVNITAQASDSNATVSGDTGAKPLNVGVNTFTVTVTAGDGKTKKEYTVTITREEAPPAIITVTGVTLDKPAYTLYTNKAPQTFQLTATVIPADASNTAVNWQSSNTSVAEVDGSGNVTAIANGTATIIVTTTDGNHKASCTVTVKTDSSDTGGGGGGNSGSSSGSSGGGSSTSRNYIITTPEPPKPNNPVLAVIELPVTIGNGTATGKPDDGRTASAIAEAGRDAKANTNGIAVQYDAKTATAYDGFSIAITQDTLKRLIDAKVKVVTLNTGIVDLSLDLAALREIHKQATSDIILTAARESGLTGDALAAVGSRPAYRLTVGYTGADGKAATVQNFGAGRVTVGLAYKPAATEQTGSLFLVYSADGKGAEWLYQSSYDRTGGNVIASTGHFSVYGVGYKPTTAFIDTVNHWAKADIDFVASRGLLTGTSDTAFTPDGATTRGMFVMALGRLAGIDPAAYPSRRFTDVAATASYAPYVEWAASKGIVTGTGETAFCPDDTITREQMAAIMQRYADKMGATLPVAREAEIFADEGQITSGMKNAVQAMQQAGVMNGKDGHRFGPKDTATRAEAAAVLRRFVEIVIDPASSGGWGQNDAGRWLYYENNKPVTGWKQINSTWYYFDASGLMQAGGWREIGGKWYYFLPDGAMAVNTKIDGYEVGPDGKRKEKEN